MAKLKKTELEEENCRTRAVIAYGMERQNVTDTDIANRICRVERTVWNKKRHPETFTLLELRILIKMLKLDERQIVELIGVERSSK